MPIHYSFVLHPAAQADLNALWERDLRSAAVLTATLEQIKADLGIFSRDFNYDRNDIRTRRVVADYDALGIPAYR